MAENGDRQRDRIISNRESEVLPDQPPGLARHRDGERHRLQALAKEHEIGGVAADVRGGRRRHRDMGGGERRRVVQAIAHHQHLASRGGERGEPRGLVARQDPGLEALDAELGGELPNRAGLVAGDDLDIEAGLRQLRDRFRRAGANLVLEAKRLDEPPVS